MRVYARMVNERIVNGYRRASLRERIVVLMTKEEVEAIDRWGVPTGMRSRAEAIRQLVERGLRASHPGARDDASEGLPGKPALLASNPGQKEA